jgi:DNA-binding PadR family transcriptional regulator
LKLLPHEVCGQFVQGVPAAIHVECCLDEPLASVYFNRIGYNHYGYICREVINMGPRHKTATRPAESFLPLKPRIFLMLLALVQEQRHGYALKEELIKQTKGRLNLGPGTLYRTLHSMLKDGLVEESDDRPDPADDDERRRYYLITDLGREVVAAEAERLSLLVETAKAERLIP